MITEEFTSKIIKQLNKEDADIIEYKQLTAQVRVKEIPISQDEADMKALEELIIEKGINLEYNIKNILRLSDRRYVKARRNLLSFHRGAMTIGRTSRLYNYQEPVIEKIVQEKLI